METFAQRLGTFAAGLTPSGLPRDIVEQAARLLLDTAGVTLAAVPEEFAGSIQTVARGLGGPPEASLWGAREQVGMAAAVLANGTLAHGLDYDDTLEDAIVHTGSCCATAALAAGEARHAPGAEVLAALVAGVEVMAAVGSVCPGAFHRRGFHPTALCGAFGAAAATGRLLGLTAAQFTTAFGLCGSQASGIIEYLADGSWTKRLHAGWAAHAGVVAAHLAQAGFTGPRTVFEGTHGFYQAFGGEPPDAARLAALADGLGREWFIQRLMFKAYPCGSINQPYMDCAARIRTRPGFDPAAIRAIVCRTAEGPVHRLWEPLAREAAPDDPLRREVQLAVLHCARPRGRPGGGGWVQRGADPGPAHPGRGRPGGLRPGSDPALPPALHGARAGRARRRARAGGNPGRAAGWPRATRSPPRSSRRSSGPMRPGCCPMPRWTRSASGCSRSTARRTSR